MAENLNRAELKREMKGLVRDAEVNAKAFTALFLLLVLALDMVNLIAGGETTELLPNPLALFVSVLTYLMSNVLSIGFVLYCMAVRRRERAEFAALFDGFSFAGRVVGLVIVESFFIFLWSLLLVIPGIVAAYRYRFAYYNLCENPELGAMEALDLSKKQTMGYKQALLALDLSYLGWALLAGLPAIWLQQMDVVQSLISDQGGLEFSVPVMFGLSYPVALLLTRLWSVAVSVFYFPVEEGVALAYYEAAKAESGALPILPPLDTE